jgi:hypothetical protein
MTDPVVNHAPPPNGDTPEYREQLLGGPQRTALMVGLVGAIVFLVLAGWIFTQVPKEMAWKQAFLSYLTGFVFWMLIGFGSVFFLMIQYVTGGRWGILLRRPLEANGRTIFVLGFILFVPVAINMNMGGSSIYWWSEHYEHMRHGGETHEQKPPSNKDPDDPIGNVNPRLDFDEDEKVAEWLSPLWTTWAPGAVIRGLLYIAIFSGLVYVMWWRNGRTAEYDENLEVAAAARNRQKYISSFGLFVFAATMTLIATDWIMSLEKTFTSSMFPVIMFDNAAVSAYCIGLLTLLYIKRKGDTRFQNLFPPTEQIHLGSLLLAFTLAWTYFNFSQYMLIWIGNLPEEIPYYLKRTRGGWGWYAALAVVFHFPIPFLLLLFRHFKANPKALRGMCIMLICVIVVDVMWWISPSMSHAEMPKFYWLMDVAAWVGVGGVWVWWFLGQLKKHPLLPTREVYLLEAYHHGH